MAALFEPLRIRSVEFKNRIFVSPMCQYSSVDGLPNEWHMVHLGCRAVGGSALVTTEATGVEAAGRISPGDTGIYNDAQKEAWKPITHFIKEHGAVPGIQLAHAGRKASTDAPWRGGKSLTTEQGGWSPIFSCSPVPFTQDYATPVALDEAGIDRVVGAFKQAAHRSLEAGFEVIELHGAHGYLINQFLSPLSNHRKDAYGGSFENRSLFLCRIIEAVRQVWPDSLPLFLRISATDWVEGGWTIDDSVRLAQVVKPLGVDFIDCSSGGSAAGIKIPIGPGYQVPFAERIRTDAGIMTGAVGMITDPEQSEEIVASGQADAVLLARELLRDPYWPRRAAKNLGAEIEGPLQYGRAW